MKTIKEEKLCQERAVWTASVLESYWCWEKQKKRKTDVYSLKISYYMEDTSKAIAKRSGEYVLKASDKETPMPNETQTESFSFSMTGDQHIQLEEIVYTEPGIYRYEAYQDIPENQKNQ